MRRLAFPLLVLAAACGDDGGSKQTDAGTLDGQLDAASGTPVKITITAEGVGVAGVRVHFQNPDSTVIASAMTDATGVASSPMPNGGFVTALNAFPSGVAAQRVKTFAGVKPGDELVLNQDFPASGVDLVITAPYDSTASVVEYQFETPCGGNSTVATGTGGQVTVALDSRCEPTTDVLVTSLDNSSDVVKWVYAPNVTTSAPADLSAMTLTAATSKTYTFNNVPVSGLGIDFFAELYSAKGKLFETDGTGGGTTVASTLKLPVFPNAIEVMFGGCAAPFGAHTMIDWGPVTSAYTTDVGARLLREATSEAAFDTTSHRIVWTEATTGQAPDFANVAVQAYREAGSFYIYWELVAPYAAGEVKFPTLPVEGVDVNFAATDVIDIFTLNLGKIDGGYDAVREGLLALEYPQQLASATPTSFTLEDIDPEGGGLLRRLTRAFRVAAPRWNMRHK